MVIGVFMAIVLVGLLFYVAGVGTITFRQERMQDAADAVALATAVGHARGMNLIVFINLVMAALVAILLALKLIELLLTGLILILAAISWLVPPAAGAIPIVENARSTVHNIHDTAKDIIDTILIGLNMAERAIAYITPAQSVLMSGTKVTEKYGPTVDFAVGVPTRISLPVENDKYNTLCDRAEIVLKGLIDWATDPIPFIGKIISLATGALLTAVKHAFCYEDQEAPSAPLDITRMLPMSENGQQCEEDKSHLQEGQACQDWQQELLDRHPDADGDCPPSGSRSELCKATLADARVNCEPGKKDKVTSYAWSEQQVQELVVFDTTSWSWVTKEYEYVDPPAPDMHNTSTYAKAQAEANQAEALGDYGESLEQQRNTDKGVPCQNPPPVYDYYGQTIPQDGQWSAWNAQTTWKEFPGVTRPVCDKKQQAMKQMLPNGGEIPPETPDRSLPPGFNPAGYTLTYPAVKQVYGCTQDATIDMTFPQDWTSTTGSQNGDDKAPQKIEEGVELGSEAFQIRGIAAHFAEREQTKADRGLFHGAFDRTVPPEGWVEAARIANKVAVAQAEYYFNHGGDAPREDWMWSMDWRARLVRFRMPGDDQQQQQQQNASQQQNAMGLGDLASVAGEKLNIDVRSVNLEGAPSLDSIGSLIVH